MVIYNVNDFYLVFHLNRYNKEMKRKLFKITLLILISAATEQLSAKECSETKTERFINNENGTTDDLKTNLTWMTCPIGLSGDNCQKGQIQHVTWLNALNIGLTSTFNQKSNWRLPKRNELLSLIETDCIPLNKATINNNAFPNTPKGFFWSASKRHDNSMLAQAINFSDGLDYEKDRFQYYYVRLVKTSE